MQHSNTKNKPTSGWSVFIGFCLFFSLVFLANGIMTFFALNSWQGVETENAYVKGLDYNQQIMKAQEQNSSGWEISFTQLPSSQRGEEISLNVVYPEASNPPAKVTASFTRPAQNGFDFEHNLLAKDVGNYAAFIQFPLKGNWKVKAAVTLASGDEYYLEERIIVK